MHEKTLYSYAEMEGIFAQMYVQKAPDRMLALRARIKNFQRMGVPLGRRPGRGSKKPYDLDEVYQLLFCLELSELTVDPTVTIGILQDCWVSSYSTIFRDAENKTRDFRKDQCLTFVLHGLAEKATGAMFDPWFFEEMRGGKRNKLLQMPHHSVVLNVSAIVRSFSFFAGEMRSQANGGDQEA